MKKYLLLLLTFLLLVAISGCVKSDTLIFNPPQTLNPGQYYILKYSPPQKSTYKLLNPATEAIINYERCEVSFTAIPNLVLQFQIGTKALISFPLNVLPLVINNSDQNALQTFCQGKYNALSMLLKDDNYQIFTDLAFLARKFDLTTKSVFLDELIANFSQLGQFLAAYPYYFKSALTQDEIITRNNLLVQVNQLSHALTIIKPLMDKLGQINLTNPTNTIGHVLKQNNDLWQMGHALTNLNARLAYNIVNSNQETKPKQELAAIKTLINKLPLGDINNTTQLALIFTNINNYFKAGVNAEDILTAGINFTSGLINLLMATYHQRELFIKMQYEGKIIPLLNKIFVIDAATFPEASIAIIFAEYQDKMHQLLLLNEPTNQAIIINKYRDLEMLFTYYDKDDFYLVNLHRKMISLINKLKMI